MIPRTICVFKVLNSNSFPRFFMEGEYEYRADCGWVNGLEDNTSYEGEDEWLVRASYILSRNFSI